LRKITISVFGILALLSGHFIIELYDGAYAEAHVGMIDFQVDIVKTYVCFKGRIAYDLNVLKVNFSFL
jgi:hypothetical protein